MDCRRQPNTDALGAPFGDQRFHDVDEQARAVLRRSAITIGPPIAAIAQELVDQITVGAVQFDTVKAGHSRIARGAPVILDNAGDFLGLKRARGDEWLHPVRRHHLTCRSNR